MERDVHLFGEPGVEAPEEGAASGEENAVLYYVGIKLGGSLLQDVLDRTLYLGNRLCSRA